MRRLSMPDITQGDATLPAQGTSQQNDQAASMRRLTGGGTGDDELESTRLCERCRLIPTTACSSYEVYRIHVDLQKLEKSACRICRLIGRVVALFHYAPNVYRLMWEPSADESSQIIGNLVMVPYYAKVGALAIRLPVASIISTAPNSLNTALRQGYPEMVDMERIMSWLHECDLSPYRTNHAHTRCARDSQDSLRNFRLINCHTRRIVTAPSHSKYVALSYVWGLSTDQVLLTECELPENLPQTIEDSIAVALMLNYAYIWIDRYISQMGTIYSAADVVILAASGIDPTSGLPGVSWARPVYADYELLDPVALINHQVHALKRIQESALASRAWTLQEGCLAKRRLYFTDNQVVCVYNESVQTESEIQSNLQRHFLGVFGNSIAPSRDSHDNLFQSAKSLLEEYTKRKLSYESDALNGISGVLEVLRLHDPALQHRHTVPFRPRGAVEQVWSCNRVQMGLDWIHPKQATRRVEFPSWSPLGWEGSVRFHNHPQPSVTFWDSLQDLAPDTRLLKIYGACVELSLTYIYNPIDSSFIRYIIMPQFEQTNRSILVEPLWDSGETYTETSGIVFGVMLNPITVPHAMVLLLVKHESHYQRVGCLAFYMETVGEGCQTIAMENDEIVDRGIYLLPAYLEALWRQVAVMQTLVVG